MIDFSEERNPDPGFVESPKNSLPATMAFEFEPQLMRKLSSGVNAMERVKMEDRNRVKNRMEE